MKLITEYGAAAGGSIATAAIQAAIDAAAQGGGGTVCVPAGEFTTGSLQLKDNVCLHLEPGATLRFSDDPADFPAVESSWEGAPVEVHRACLYAKGAKNIALTGQGVIDGSGQRWWKEFRARSIEYPRPKLIGFEDCEGVLLRDVRLLNSPAWTVHPLRCSRVVCDNVSILNAADSPNTDGINPESCTNVHISNCHIDVGDDCIAIKAGTEATSQRVACENITITNCTMVHGHGGIVLGSEMSGGIRNVTVSNCVFQDTDRGIRFKSRRGRGGTVEDVRVDNIVMDNVMCPFIINLYYFCGPKGDDKYVWDKSAYPVTGETPCFRRIHFANVTARNVHASAGFVYGLCEKYADEITFDNISVSMAENPVPGMPAMMAGIENMTRQGFRLSFASDVLLRNVRLENHEGPAFLLENTRDVRVEGCTARSVFTPDAPLVEEV